MGRLIDADALYTKLQELEELARKRVLDTESTLPCPTNLNPVYTRYLAQLDERIQLKHMIADAPTVYPEQPKMGKWIPCKKKLPEKYGFYLVSLNNGTTDFCLWNAMEFGWESSGIFSKCDEVTAWMPLPEPYRGGEEDGTLD